MTKDMTKEKKPSWKHEYADVNNIRMHYVTQGKGPLMLMLHGFPEFWYSWRHQIPVMARRFKVVAVDMRGYNQTEKPVGVANYRIEVLARDVADLIRALGYEKAVVVAHDWGGGVAWPFAMAYPEMVDRLIVLNCPPPGVLMDHFQHNRAQLKRSYYMFLFQVPRLPEAALPLPQLRHDRAGLPRLGRRQERLHRRRHQDVQGGRRQAGGAHREHQLLPRRHPRGLREPQGDAGGFRGRRRRPPRSSAPPWSSGPRRTRRWARR